MLSQGSSAWNSAGWNWGYANGTAHDVAARTRLYVGHAVTTKSLAGGHHGWPDGDWRSESRPETLNGICHA